MVSSVTEHPVPGSRWCGPTEPGRVFRSKCFQPTLEASVTTPASSYCVFLLSSSWGLSAQQRECVVLCSRPSSGFLSSLKKRPHSVYSLYICLSHLRPFWLLPLQLSSLLPLLQPWPPCCAVNSPGLKILAFALLFLPLVRFLQISPGLSSNATFPIRLLVATLSPSLVLLPSPFPCVLSLNSN